MRTYLVTVSAHTTVQELRDIELLVIAPTPDAAIAHALDHYRECINHDADIFCATATVPINHVVAAQKMSNQLH
jgi:hypothetical protein